MPEPDDTVISVLTPLFAKGIEFVHETWDSLRAQELPKGISLEWVVQEDADTPSLAPFIEALTSGDSRVHYQANGCHRGQAVTRTMAFHNSRGSYVYAIDQDDILQQGALSALYNILATKTSVHWVTGHVRRLFEDGQTKERIDPLEDGLLPAGFLLELFDQGITTAFYPTATMFRRQALHVLGAWPAVIAAEDAELQLAMGTAFDGFRIPNFILDRRKWSGQAVLAEWYQEPDIAAISTRRARAGSIEKARAAGMFDIYSPAELATESPKIAQHP